MKEKNLSVTETELRALDYLWDEGQGSIKAITQAMYGEDYSFSEYTTVQKLLDRLEGKSCVKKVRQGRINIYCPLVERKELFTHRLEKVAEELCDGSLTPLILNLADNSKLNESEIKLLKDIINQHKGAHK